MLSPARFSKSISLVALLALAATVLSFCVGPSWLSPGSLFDALFNADSDTTESAVALLRLNRTFAGLVVGACLSLSGALCQGVLRNPLADPYILGISGGAGLAVVISLAFLGGVVGVGGFLLAAPAVLGAALAVLTVVAFLAKFPRLGLEGVLLVGVMINSFCAAIILTVASFLGEAQLLSFYRWLLGSLSSQSYEWSALAPALILVAGLSAILLIDAKRLNLLALSADEASSLGMNVPAMRKYFLVIAAVLCAVSVALAGLVGFVGLVAPHLCRRIIGADARLLLPCSALLGAALVVLCDTVARTVVSPSEMPVGVVTALVGAPVFMSVLVSRAARSAKRSV
ncbi:MAG: iron ABC transporter permease [Planctomycetota bacterium]